MVKNFAIQICSWLFRHLVLGLEIILLGLSLYFFYLCTHIIIQTLWYPYDLNFLEGGTIHNIMRIFEGLPLYTNPTVEYSPYIYTPLYNYLSALVAVFTGVDFVAARLVSVFATIIIITTIMFWCRKEGLSWTYAIIGAALYLSVYEITDQIMFAARVDSAAIAFYIVGAAFLYFGNKGLSTVLAGLFFFLCVMTKQTLLLPILALMLWQLFYNFRRAFCVGLVGFALGLPSIYWLQMSSDGWFFHYVMTLPSTSYKRDIFYFLEEILRYNFIGAFITIIIGSVLAIFYLARDSSRKASFYFCLVAGGAVASTLSRLHVGGSLNVMMPAYVSFIIPCVLFVYWAKKETRDHLYGAVNKSLLCMLIIHMVINFYDYKYFVPDEASIKAQEKFLRTIGEIPGEVFVPERCFIQTKVEKISHAFSCMGAFDSFHFTQTDALTLKVVDNLIKDIENHRFSAIIMDSRVDNSLISVTNPHIWAAIFKHYRPDRLLIDGEYESLKPRWGYGTRPDTVFVPNE